MATASSSKQLPLPAAIRRGGRRGWIAAVGGVLGAVTLIDPSLIVPSPLPKEAAFAFLAIWLGVTAAACLGFALQGWANQGARHRWLA